MPRKTRAAKKAHGKKVAYSRARSPARPASRRRRPSALRRILKKPDTNPILSPDPEHDWEAWQVFNPGVVLLGAKTHFLYRAIGTDGISRLGYAVSSDGFHIDERLPRPVYEHRVKKSVYNVFSYFSGGSFGGAEDPRLTRVEGEDVLYMTYTACDEGLRMTLTSIGMDDFLKRRWKWKKPVFLSPEGEVHKNWVIFPEKIRGQYAILHSISPAIDIEYIACLPCDDAEFIKSRYTPALRKNCWDGWVRGVGAPPIKTAHGWLVFYHAMQARELDRYKVGALLLDSADPTRVLYRSSAPVLEPTKAYEQSGYKSNVVYVTGAVVKDGTLFIYYGAADSSISVAYAPLEAFLGELMRGEALRVTTKTVLKKT